MYPARRPAPVDACPGALQTHAAADGGAGPGSRARRHADRRPAAGARRRRPRAGRRRLELTSRGNLQLRGLADGRRSRRSATGWPPPGCCPARRTSGCATCWPARCPAGPAAGTSTSGRGCAAFDAGLLRRPGPRRPARPVPGHPGRRPRRRLRSRRRRRPAGPGARTDVALLLGGADSGLRATAAGAVDLRWPRPAPSSPSAPRRASLGLAADRAGRRARPGRRPGCGQRPPPTRWTCRPRRCSGPVGAAAQVDGRTALIGVVPLGRLTADQVDLLARLAPEVQLTPWRSVVVPDLAEDAVDDAAVDLYRTGIVFDEASPWLQVTACAGRPGCAKSLADVRADASRRRRRGDAARRRRPTALGRLRAALRPPARGRSWTSSRPAPATGSKRTDVRLREGRRRDLPAVVRDHPRRGGPRPGCPTTSRGSRSA